MDIRFDGTKNIAYIKITGPASSKEILEAFDIAVSSEKYKKGMGRLWDFTEADLSSIDSYTIRKMAQYSLNRSKRPAYKSYDFHFLSQPSVISFQRLV